MAFDPSTATLQFDPSTAVEASSGFDPSTATEFNPTTAKPAESKLDTGKIIKDQKNLIGSGMEKSNLSAVLSIGDMIAGLASVPTSWMLYANELSNGGNFAAARAKLETTQEWGSLKTLIKHYGEKLGLDPKSIDETISSPNFIDEAFKGINDKALDPAARAMNLEPGGMPEKAFKDAAGFIVPGVIAKGLGTVFKARVPATDPIGDINRILEQRKQAQETNTTSPFIRDYQQAPGVTLDEQAPGLRQSPIARTGQQLETQMGDHELAQTQGELGAQGDLQFDPSTAKPIEEPVAPEPTRPNMMVPQEEPTPMRDGMERQGELPLETPVGQTPDMFAPLDQSRDVNMSQAKNPFLEESAIKPPDQGQQEMFNPQGEVKQPNEQPNIGTATPTGLEDAGLPFRLSGVRFDANGKRAVTLGQIKKGQGGWVKLPGGEWTGGSIKDAVAFLNEGFERLGIGGRLGNDWSTRVIKNYFNKYLGTERDPLKDIVLQNGQRWEDITDGIVQNKGETFNENKWSAEMGTPEGIHAERNYIQFTDFIEHVGDYVANHVPKDQLDRYDFVRAAKETIAQDERQAKAMEKARGSGEGTTIHKQYDDGMKWVEVGKSDKPSTTYTVGPMLDAFGKPYREEFTIYKDGKRLTNAVNIFKDKDVAQKIANSFTNEDALRSEGDNMGHCVGGYCEAVHNGDTRIFSLRDEKNNSHVTIEVSEDIHLPPSIRQIKGKQNAAPVDKYIPYVQDFVKSSGMDVTGDLHNSKLYYNNTKEGTHWPAAIQLDFPDGVTTNKFKGMDPRALAKYLPEGQKYFTKDEMVAAAEKWYLENGKSSPALGTIIKGQSGSIQYGKPGMFLARVFQSSPESQKFKLDQLVSKYTKYKDLIADKFNMFVHPEKDIGFTGNIVVKLTTKNQSPNVVNAPSITYSTGKIRNINIDYHIKANAIADLVESFLGSVSKKESYRVMNFLTEVNKPKWQEWLKANGVKEVSEEQLKALGATDKEIAGIRQVRQINDKLGEIMQVARKNLDGTELDLPVLSYHPRSYGIGPNALVVFEKKSGDVIHVHRYKNYDDMVVDHDKLVDSFTKADQMKDYEILHRTASKEWENPFANINATNIPEVIQKILAGMEESIETRTRTFELHRATNEIGGLVQHLSDGSVDPALMDVWNAHIRNVLQFSKNVDLFNLQREFITPEARAYLADKGFTADYIQNMIQKELGSDITWKPLRFVAGALTELMNAVAKAKPGRKILDPDDFIINRNSARENAKFASSMASAGRLLFDTPNAVNNGIQLPLTGVTSIPLDIMTRLRMDPVTVMKWTVQANAEFGQSLIDWAAARTTGIPNATSRMIDNYAKQGLISAHMFDEISDVAHSTIKGLKQHIAAGLNVGKTYTNDMFIEQPVNRVSLIYYDNLINRIAKPHLLEIGATPEQIKELPIVLAKSWTGDYAKWTQPMYLEHLGITGDLTSNFAKWPANQAGRFIEVLKDAFPDAGVKGVGKSAFNGIVATVAWWYVYAQLAGGQNSPGVTTWETIKDAYNQYGTKREEDHIPDTNYYMHEYGVPEWAFPTKSILERAQRAVGIQNPVDLGSGQRYSNPINMNTVTPSFWTSVIQSINVAGKMMYDSKWGTPTPDNKPQGFKREDVLNAVSGLPRLIRGQVQEKVGTEARPDGTTAVLNKYGSFSYTQNNDTEKFINNVLGMKTTRQTKQAELNRNDKIVKQNLVNVPANIRSTLESQMGDMLSSGGQGTFSSNKDVVANLIKLMNSKNIETNKDLKALMNQAEDKYLKSILSTAEYDKYKLLSAKTPPKSEKIDMFRKRMDSLAKQVGLPDE